MDGSTSAHYLFHKYILRQSVYLPNDEAIPISVEIHIPIGYISDRHMNAVNNFGYLH